jgi:23S rRNA (pseudouridine1915-N3)-methyltransferase
MRIIAIGKLKEKWISEGIYEYAKRIKNLEITEIKDSKGEDGILESIRESEKLVVLSEEGKMFGSVEFAELIKQDKLVFVIGGPDGFTTKTKSKARYILSLSKMTFTHEMARLFLIEQIYRAQSINDNKNYHRK